MSAIVWNTLRTTQTPAAAAAAALIWNNDWGDEVFGLKASTTILIIVIVYEHLCTHVRTYIYSIILYGGDHIE